MSADCCESCLDGRLERSDQGGGGSGAAGREHYLSPPWRKREKRKEKPAPAPLTLIRSGASTHPRAILIPINISFYLLVNCETSGTMTAANEERREC